MGPDGRALARRGFEIETSADHLQPLPHAEQAEASLPCRSQHAFRVEEFAVLLELQANAAGQFLNAHVHMAGLRRARDVGECLLRDAKKDRAPDAIQLFHRSKGCQSSANAGARGELFL